MRRTAKSPDVSTLEDRAAEVSTLLRALGNERRLMLLCALIEQDECTAGELSEAVSLSASATSQHLAKMRSEGLVDFRREAQSLYYRIADPRTLRLIALLKELYCR